MATIVTVIAEVSEREPELRIMVVLEFNVPLTTLGHGDGTSVYSLVRQTGGAEDRISEPWIARLAR